MSVEPTVTELERRVIFALMQPVVDWCRRLKVPLNELEQLSRLAYYEELRRNGHANQKRVAEIFGKSLRTVGEVERQYQSTFLAPEYEVEISRKVGEALETQPQSTATLADRLNLPAKDVERALAGLEAVGRAQYIADKGYRRRKRFQSLVRDDLLARIDGLKHQLEVISATVNARFLGEPSEAPSMARTLSFVAKAADAHEMGAAVARELRMRAIDVEETALNDGGYERYGLTFALAATDKSD